MGEGMASVERLGQAVAAGLRSRSVRFDDRPLSPHLTLARVLADASMAEARTVAAAIDALQVPDLFTRSEEHTSELQSRFDLVCRLLLEKKNKPSKLHVLYTSTQVA